jgi:valyl-tRNA synthetase
MLARLAEVITDSTLAFHDLDYARALERTEEFFWWFCDDYVELVKGRAYGTQGDNAAHSARAALRQALEIIHRLFAPFLPFVTDEVWSWWQPGSVHAMPWPTAESIAWSRAFRLRPDLVRPCDRSAAGNSKSWGRLRAP